MWENACGYLKKDQMHNIVTSGIGLFGPNMRVGTGAEICPITIRFN
jgi:predicted MPP superfamily phosphohydrolase